MELSPGFSPPNFRERGIEKVNSQYLMSRAYYPRSEDPVARPARVPSFPVCPRVSVCPGDNVQSGCRLS